MVRARSLEFVSGSPPFAQLILDLSGPRVDDSDDAFFTCHTLFVFIGGAEIGEAFVGVFLVSVFFPPLAFFIALGFLVWWRPLNASTL
jgi:hypothetical protein